MDNLGWDVYHAAAAMNTASFLWSNQQNNNNIVAGQNYSSIFGVGGGGDLQAASSSNNGQQLGGSPFGGFQDAIISSTIGSSLDSLDHCSDLSGTNTDDNSVVEGDGISMILSNCDTTHRNFGSTAITPKPNKRKSTNYCPDISSSMKGAFITTEDNNHPPNFNSNPKKVKKPRSEKLPTSTISNISFQQANTNSPAASSSSSEPLEAILAHTKEMIYRAAMARAVVMGPGPAEVMEKPKRKNVRISNEPQTVAARQRRERIGERMRVLQQLVPGGSKMDTASMLGEAANYLKFLRSQLKALENLGHKFDPHYCFLQTNYFHHSFPI